MPFSLQDIYISKVPCNFPLAGIDLCRGISCVGLLSFGLQQVVRVPDEGFWYLEEVLLQKCPGLLLECIGH